MKKLFILFLAVIFATSCFFAGCGDAPETDKPNSEEETITQIDFNSLSGWKTVLLDNREAGMPDVNNHPLVIAHFESVLEFTKKSENGKSFNVFRYTSIERNFTADGTNGDEALKQVDLYKKVYTVAVGDGKYYYELYEKDFALSESLGEDYPAVTHELSEATESEKTEIENLISPLLPNNNTLSSFKTKFSLNTFDEKGKEKASFGNVSVYETADGKYQASADKNGVLLYGRSVSKTIYGSPAGQTYYPYSYALSLSEPVININLKGI